jgi:hypothetical protein
MMTEKIALIIKHLISKKSPDMDSFAAGSYHIYKEELMSIPYKVFKKKIRVEKILSNSFF